ncbi:hypothetical protein Tco_0748910 [Tanacetum coccineum]|uniref:Uncharacterized protein n=1 Tax=Tanacetum coccineum TaxID=301880 RepID=A0ABQ4YWY7_9ASTR
MHKNKSANRNPANYRLYHALMEALLEDENAMDKEVADKVKDHKRKRDSDDDEDDDDEGPSAGSNQGESTKRRRHESSASGSAQPPSKDSEQSTKNKLDSNTSAAQQPPAHTSSAWQITDTRDTPPGPSMQRSDHQSKQSSDDNPITDEGHVSDPEDTDNAHIPKVPAATWFKPIPEEERPATPEPEWTIPSNDYPEPENNWANVYATTYQDPEENKLQRKTGDIGSFIKWFCKRTGKKKLFKADLEGDKEQKIALSISKLKAARYLNFGLEELVQYLWVENLFLLHSSRQAQHLPKSDKVNLHTAVNMWIRNIVIRKRVEDLQLGVESYQTKLNLEQPNWDASDFLFKEDYTIFSDGTLMRIRDKLDFTVKDLRLFKFNKGMETRKWTEDDKRRSKEFIEVIEKRLKIRRIFQSLESLSVTQEISTTYILRQTE